MKAIVLTLLSCVLLGGVYGILNKKSQVSSLLSSKTDASLPQGQGKTKAATATATSSNKADTSNTLNDSHWLDDETFQKAVEAELLSNNQENEEDHAKEATTEKRSEAPSYKSEESELVPNVRQLILELHPDTTTNKKGVPVEVV